VSGGQSIEWAAGLLVSSSGISYRRTPERVKRSNGRALVRSGIPIVTDVYPDDLRIYEGDDARHAWQEIEPRLVAGKPPRVRDLQWVGHVYTSDEGKSLLYFEGQH
jgi:hypothetical protein